MVCSFCEGTMTVTVSSLTSYTFSGTSQVLKDTSVKKYSFLTFSMISCHNSLTVFRLIFTPILFTKCLNLYFTTKRIIKQDSSGDIFTLLWITLWRRWNNRLTYRKDTRKNVYKSKNGDNFRKA